MLSIIVWTSPISCWTSRIVGVEARLTGNDTDPNDGAQGIIAYHHEILYP